jgi:flagellar biosynthesis protein FlgN
VKNHEVNMTVTISFEEDAQLMHQLLELLEHEQKNLVINNVKEIEAAIATKTVLLKKINAAAKKRYAVLESNHFEANENGMLAWVLQQTNPSIKERWDTFQRVLVKAKEMNRLNGILITKHFNRNQQMLQNLQIAFKSSDVYGKNGQTKSNTSSRSSLTA